MSELPKHFDPAAIEARWYAHWEEQGLFRPERDGAEPFTIVNPPPNVTGSLHIGHALDNTLQDILVRHQRLLGKDALWVVGTDHAGIATQMVVERNLASQGVKRTEMPREAFVEHVWEWKAQSGGQITRQLRRLGCSMDWANERFTMDEGFTKAVTKVFVDLYNDGLIYRDKRLVNWDPALRTAISDLEVEAREVRGHMWHFKYPLGGGETYTYVERDADGNVVFEEERDYISIATTRPETMLGDGAVAVHPDDARYAPIVGKLCEIPVGPKEHRRLIPIITDEYPDREFGSGAVKITGAHDENDYEVAQRAGIPMYRLMDEVAAMRTDGAPYAQAAARAVEIAKGAEASAAEIDALNLVPDEYRGLDRYDARVRVVADIDDEGLMIKVEDKVLQQPFGDRGGVVIEPMLTDQWYVDAETLAQAPIKAVREGKVNIVPKSWEKTFFNWMENIRPWCVSRQLWWGHRIPAWYGPPIGYADDHQEGEPLDWIEELPNLENIVERTWSAKPEVFVANSAEEAMEQAKKRYSDAGLDLEMENGFKLEFVDSHSEARDGFVSARLGIWQDPDVLDTWFSSALWPFATIGWPEDATDNETVSAEPVEARLSADSRPSTSSGLTGKTSAKPGTELARHYPNDVLISGFDILFFWDARMLMQGMHFMGEAPWKTLYLHGLVRAADGQKMSKSKGNTVDPLGLIDQYGADALRFFMAAMESQGRDIKMDEKRVEGYRNFATKLWNAARFCQANGIGASATLEAPEAEKPVNRWIIAETIQTIQKLDLALADLRFDGAANTIYHFTWDRFCDWYLELIKPVVSDDERGQIDDETKSVVGWVLDQILVMLHPFMPFVTEELWSKMGARDGYPLITAKWPVADARAMDEEAVKEIDWLIRLIGDTRTARSELNIPPGAKLTMHVRDASEQTLERLARQGPALARVGRIESVSAEPAPGGSAAQIPVDEATYIIPLEGVIDLDAEKARLTKSLEAAEKEAGSLDKRLSNPQFVEKAKPEAVEKARADHAEKTAEADRLRAALERLG
ncbi:MAG: valine--tRNA ligase [Parasphingopyxis sp.]|uniref:valine--tRNA ligase n=1 Tax=Parasphingopyxis sp. TaxID=1920299 RepID=UPI003F9EFA1C